MIFDALALAIARGVHVCGVLSIFGLLTARSARFGGKSGLDNRLLRASLWVAFGSAPIWVIFQAREMSGATTLGETFAASPVALFSTGFGHALLLRLALLAAVAGLARWHSARYLAWAAAAAAFIVQIKMGHAAAPDGAWQAQASALHMVAAGAWIGSLLPLAIGLGENPARTARRFSLIGLGAVLVLATTAYLQAAILVGGLPGLLGSAYGLTVVFKIGLFVLLLGFAALNRFRFSPALNGPAAKQALLRLRRSIYGEACVGAIAVLVAAWLSGLPPGAHEQPVWPLPWYPSWDSLDDPDILRQLQIAGVALVLSVVLGLAAFRWRILWLGSLIGIAATIWCIAPQLGSFVVPAYPTSFFESPTGLTKASVAAGGIVYHASCASCHGPRGFGDGPLASELPVRPSPLTGFHLLERSDGEMFWFVSKGLGAAMPGFDVTLTDLQRWSVIDYVRSLAGAEPGDSPAPSHHHH
jgi:putative copper export protein/mono/diheme cytochrome c family protein